jgi:hypothetical protein
VTEYEYRTAQVRANSFGEWKLRVRGTDIYQQAFAFRHPELDPFPGKELIEQLLDLGWVPDRRALLAPVGASMVQTRARQMLAGWKPSDVERGVWTIPVYREKT